MKLLERRRALMSALTRFIRTVLGIPPITLEACVNDKSTVDYKLYGNSIQDGTPTPDAPIEVESVGEKTVNLFDVDTFMTLDGNTTYYELNENGDLVQKTNDYRNSNALPTAITLPAGTYRVNSYIDGNHRWYNKTASVVLNEPTFTLTETSEITVKWWKGAGKVIGKPMVYKGSKVIDYEPYGKYKIPVVASGKNLFDINQVTGFSNYNTAPHFVKIQDGVITCNMGAYGTGVFTLCNIKFLPKGTYTLSCDCRVNSDDTTLGKDFYIGIVKIVDGVRKIVNKYMSVKNLQIWERLSFTFTLDSDTEIYGFQFQGVGNSTNYTEMRRQFKDIHLGTQEPITTNIYLDEPLRKIGDYADYIDFENRVVVRNVAKKSGLLKNNIYGIYRKLSTVVKFHCSAGGLMKTPVLCAILPYKSEWTSNSEDIMSHTTLNNNTYYSIKWERLGLSYDGTNAYLINDSEKTALTNAEIVSKVKDYLSTFPNEYISVYVCRNATEEPIDLPTLPTFKGTTIYSIDTNIQPSNMEVTYYSKERSV